MAVPGYKYIGVLAANTKLKATWLCTCIISAWFVCVCVCVCTGPFIKQTAAHAPTGGEGGDVNTLSISQLQELSPDPSALSYHDSYMEHSSCVQEAVGSDGLVTLSSAVGDTSSDTWDTGSTQEVRTVQQYNCTCVCTVYMYSRLLCKMCMNTVHVQYSYTCEVFAGIYRH